MNKLLFIPFALIYSVSFSQKLPEPGILFNKMMHAMGEVKSCSFNLSIVEVEKGKRLEFYHFVKLQVKPFKSYVYCVKPNNGAEALYVEGENSNKILVNPNKFPYFSIKLAVNNMLIRKNHQFTIKQMAFTYIHPLLKSYLAKEGISFYERLKCKTENILNNKSYYVLEIHNPEFAYVNYTVKKNEDVSDIARKLLVNDHMILTLNENISNYSDVEEGQVIKVPNSFAKKIELYVDKVNFLPMAQVIYDDNGLYGKIEFSSFILNPEFKENEFSADFDKYNF